MVNLLLGFEGRISRTQFWIGLVVIVAAELILMWLLGIPFLPTVMKDVSIRVIEFAIQVVVLYPTVAIAVKRLHDRNKPGIYVLWLVGLTLVAEGFDVHVPKGFIYFAMAFSVIVELLNIRIRKKNAAPVKLHKQMER